MQKLLIAMHKKEEAFTLIELVVVMAIIGVLVAIAIPIMNQATERPEKTTIKANLRTIEGAIWMVANAENKPEDENIGHYTDSTQDAYLGNYISGFDDLGPAEGTNYTVINHHTYGHKAQITISAKGEGGFDSGDNKILVGGEIVDP